MAGPKKPIVALEETLSNDPQGLSLRALRGQLIEGQAQARGAISGARSDTVIRAYQATLDLLPELWRTKQRSK